MKIFSCSKSKQELISIKDGNSSGSPEEAVTGEVRMDVGPIHRKLLAYAAPLLLMQLLLQFYNIADCAVVGRFGGAFGLAAVGVAGLVLAVHIELGGIEIGSVVLQVALTVYLLYVVVLLGHLEQLLQFLGRGHELGIGAVHQFHT